MRTDICAREDEDTIDALLAALTTVGASYADKNSVESSECPLGVGLHRFVTTDGRQLTVFADAWGVDLEGPDELVKRVTEHLAD